MLIKKLFLFLTLTFAFEASFASDTDVKLSVQVNKKEVSLSENFSLSFVLSDSEKMHIDQAQPKYSIPEVKTPQGLMVPVFNFINEMRSVSVESYYDSVSGKFSVNKKLTVTHVLEAAKEGSWKISDIRIQIGAHSVKAAEVQVTVSGKAPSLSNQHVAMKKDAGVFLRAEVERKATSTAVKGEQVLVSYYLYHALRIYNLEYDKFPAFSGFLKEDIETPILSNRTLISQPVEYRGRQYDRALLARYAVYPIQEGQLIIDPITVRVSYQTSLEEDPFDGENAFFSLFQRMRPKSVVLRSDPLTLQVTGLPQDGKPSSFTGGIGQFDVSSAVDKYELRANEGLSFTVKIEGSGNVSSIQEPKFSLPSSLELYDTKGQAKNSNKGVGVKTFEFLIIPRAPGDYEIPSIEFGFFDPVQKKYYSRLTQAVKLKILEPIGGIASMQVSQAPGMKKTNSMDSTNSTNKKVLLKPLKNFPQLEGDSFFPPTWKLCYWVFFISLACFFVVLLKTYSSSIFSGTFHKRSQGKAALSAFNIKLGPEMSWNEVLSAYDRLSLAVIEVLEKSTGISLKSLSRRELKELLLNQYKIPSSTWEKLENLFNDCDWVKFAGSSGESLKNDARQRLEKWLEQVPTIAQSIKF